MPVDWIAFVQEYIEPRLMLGMFYVVFTCDARAALEDSWQHLADLRRKGKDHIRTLLRIRKVGCTAEFVDAPIIYQSLL